MGQATGIVEITLDDLVDNFLEGNEIARGGYIKTAVETAHNTHYSEKRVSAKVKFKVAHTSETDDEAIRGFKGTLGYKTDSGHSYKVPNAFCVGDPVIKDGEVEYEFWGGPADE